MAISIDPATKVITVPQSDCTETSPGSGVYELDVEWFRLALKDWEDSQEGIVFDDTHIRNAPVTLGGVTYAQTFEITNGYTVTFTPNSEWRVKPTSANHNIADVMNVNQVSIEVGNSAGLIEVTTGGGGDGFTAADRALLQKALQLGQFLALK